MRRLLAILSAAALVLAFAGPTTGRAYSVQIAAQVGWTPTGIVVEGGESIAISAGGFVHTAWVPVYLTHEGAADPGTGPAGGEGLTCEGAIGGWYSEAEYGPCFAWDAQFGELVARVGGGDGWGLDGGSEIVIPAGVEGMLYLAVNDYAYTLHDNSGQFTVTFR